MKRITLFTFIMLGALNAAVAQCSIAGKTKICLGDMAAYELAGSAVSSAKWKFGDGFSSNDIKAKHLYKKAGTYMVSCEAQLSSGAACTATYQVEVLNLPTPSFSRFGKRDSCQFVNNICFKDNSKPAAPGQDIVKRLLVWGDGAYDMSTNPANEPDLCHTYITADNFRLKFEVTDMYGCKNSTTTRVRIIPGPQAVLLPEVTYPECGKAKICFKNESAIPAKSRNTYTWLVNGNGFARSDKTLECYESKVSQTFTVYLKVETRGGCTSELRDTVTVNPNPLSTQLNGLDEICYGDEESPKFWITGDKDVNLLWFVNGQGVSGGDTLRFQPKQLKLKPGQYSVKVEVKRGPCTQTHTRNFTVLGPVARFRIANRVQCEMDRKVFMWDDTKLSNKSKASWYWEIEDPYGENCVAWRSKGQNLNKNCNESRDWYHKHMFTTSKSAYEISMSVFDSITGCGDIAKRQVLKACPKFCDGAELTICQGERFLEFSEYADPEEEPVAFSLDSGRTFMPYHSRVHAPYQGLYGVFLVWRKAKPDSAADFGVDSLLTFVDTTSGFDTLFYHNLLRVVPVRDTAFRVHYSGLNPKTVKLLPVVKLFLPGDRIKIFWGDSTNIDITYTDSTWVDSFSHQYNQHVYHGLIKVLLWNYRGCSRSIGIRVKWGLEADIDIDYRCGSLKVCLEPRVMDYRTDEYWKENDGLKRQFKWNFGDSTTEDTISYSPCHEYAKPGRYLVTLRVSDSLGNWDTASRLLILQEIVAGVTSESKEFYCSEIKQLFDSSYLRVYDPNDEITGYLWDFGEGTFTTVEKDPFHTFESGGTYRVVHVVNSKSGCTDTTEFVVNITGSNAAFDLLTDTVGCAPFMVTFRNRSKDCKQYIWQYGDNENTTHSTNETGNDTFRYRSHGRFSVLLIGIDTFYNPNTGNAYYCNSFYPSEDSPAIITVLPSPKTGLLGPDTLCVGSTAEFISLSDTLYEADYWQIEPDSRNYWDKPGKKGKKRYDQAGVYNVWLRPSYTIYPGQPRCFDSAHKKVTVLDVIADFDIDPKSVDPVFTFNNKTTPMDKTIFVWNFGQPNSPDNQSNEVHPTHDYFPERDTFNVCLLAVIPFGCRDTMCKPIMADYFEDIRLANVFTPNEEDDLNKHWDIVIDGERLYVLRIFNRWGELVFESEKDAERGEAGNWNGQVMNTGAQCPEGTYFYQFTYAFSRGNPPVKTVNGSINLIR